MKLSGYTARGAATTFFLGSAIILVRKTLTAQTVREQALVPAQACADFSQEAGGGGSAQSALPLPWRVSDCVDVWSAWSGTVPISLHYDYPDQQLLRETAADMRRRGSPCLVESTLPTDGVGSMTMRHLAAWMFAEEVGCDWVLPNWGTTRDSADGDGASLYCHTAATTDEEQRGFNASAEEVETILHRCSVTNWLEYFNFKATAVELPVADSFRVVEVDKSSPEDLESAVGDLKPRGFESIEEQQRLKLVFSRSHASDYFVALGSWDERKREAVREVLRVLRNNFHQFPRPWYNETPDCHYESAELNFALHLRMGDRRDIEQATSEYFQLLDNFMEAVTEGVVGKGQAEPTFHVFSETLFPCPFAENGTFPEFPAWPVEMDQIPACLGAKRPDDCPEKRAGASVCRPNRSGVFRVQGRPLLLHVGNDVTNALSCMIQADGLLMGCSTFGQLAGVLNEGGISFFSTGCGGLGTAVQYKMVPPLAVAERGHMWVPVAGSWRDPVLESSGMFMAALDELLKAKGMTD
eukprot:jgi/Undpi1/9302/HiC_scaffold_26.g11760.m1